MFLLIEDGKLLWNARKLLPNEVADGKKFDTNLFEYFPTGISVSLVIKFNYLN